MTCRFELVVVCVSGRFCFGVVEVGGYRWGVTGIGTIWGSRLSRLLEILMRGMLLFEDCFGRIALDSISLRPELLLCLLLVVATVALLLKVLVAARHCSTAFSRRADRGLGIRTVCDIAWQSLGAAGARRRAANLKSNVDPVTNRSFTLPVCRPLKKWAH